MPMACQGAHETVEVAVADTYQITVDDGISITELRTTIELPEERTGTLYPRHVRISYDREIDAAYIYLTEEVRRASSGADPSHIK